ncbi:MAG: ROK family protein [Sciscionella sp.]
MADVAIGLDVGGTKIAAGLVDADGVVRHRAIRKTPKGDAEDVWSAVRKVVCEGTDELTDDRLVGVGVGCAAPVNLTDGTVSPINIDGWQNFPLRARLTELIASSNAPAPVRLAGDGLCMALGEHWVGAGAGTRSMLGVVVSTGVGGGLVLDGVPYSGRSGNAGHVGHIVVESNGVPCTCGGKGCVETVAGGPGMVHWARVKGWQAPPHANAEHLAAAARNGKEVARTAFDRAGYAVGLAVVAAAAVCELELVVIGGGVAKAGALLFDPMHRALREHARLPYLADLRVLPAALNDDAGLIGAAALIHRHR